MAGMIEDQYKDYYEARIKPHIDGTNIEYLGLLSQKDLAPVYRKAAAVLFMINWCEPCSMVGIEAQASGTPLIGTRYGYLPEIVKDGETGFLVDTVEEAEAAVEQLGNISPRACRKNVEDNFSLETMARGYAGVYRALLEEKAEA
jgi:glycosyltransferase involved in cell wall biosynthesis